MLFFTSLPLFSSICPLVKLFLTATYCCLPHSLLPHCPLPLPSLAVGNTGGGVCSPGIHFLHLEKAGTAADQPLHFASPRAATYLQADPKSACTAVRGPPIWTLVPHPFSHLCIPHTQLFAALLTLSLLSWQDQLSSQVSFSISSLLETLFHFHKSTRELYKPQDSVFRLYREGNGSVKR